MRSTIPTVSFANSLLGGAAITNLPPPAWKPTIYEETSKAVADMKSAIEAALATAGGNPAMLRALLSPSLLLARSMTALGAATLAQGLHGQAAIRDALATLGVQIEAAPTDLDAIYEHAVRNGAQKHS